jgi:hypothetical protein
MPQWLLDGGPTGHLRGVDAGQWPRLGLRMFIGLSF